MQGAKTIDDQISEFADIRRIIHDFITPRRAVLPGMEKVISTIDKM